MRKAKITVAIIAALILSGFAYLAITSAVTAQKLEVKTIKLESTEEKLKRVKSQMETLKKQSSTEKSKLEKEKKALESKLHAKAQAKARLEIAAAKAEDVLSATQTASAAAPRQITGNKQTWLAASGIPESDWGYVDMIVSRESGWNPCAYNPGLSDCNANPTSACGLAQSLPCGKQSVYGHWTDPVANLKWQYDYVKARYNGYAGAVAFWNANHYY